MTGMGVEPTELEVIALSRVLTKLHYGRFFSVSRIHTFLTLENGGLVMVASGAKLPHQGNFTGVFPLICARSNDVEYMEDTSRWQLECSAIFRRRDSGSEFDQPNGSDGKSCINPD